MSNSESIDLFATRVDEIACGQCGHIIDTSRQESFSQIDCPKCGSRQTVPAVLGNFLLVERLGAGGMGAVYRGMDQALGRFVAIKVMKRELGADPKLLESFLREARAAAALNHRNIVQIYSCGKEQGQPYIVMELVNGGRLDLMMADGQLVPEVRLLEVALDVSEGLKAANELGLVHGDIKPANILFDKSGAAKVVDFGLAQFVHAQQERGEIWGTPYYISPERARGGRADHRSDIYSLGATLFHALSGQPPFDGPTATDVVLARLNAPAPNLAELRPELQPETCAVIGRMLEADTMRRYPTSASLQADLREALEKARTGEMNRSHVKPRKSSASKTHIVIASVVIALVLVAGALVLVAANRAKKEQERAEQQRIAQQQAQDQADAAAALASTSTAATVAAGGEPGLDPAAWATEVFFSDTNGVLLAEAVQMLAKTNAMAVAARLEEMHQLVPERSGRAQWLRILESIPYSMEGRTAQGDIFLREVARAPIKQPDGHPLFMPQRMARYLLGDIEAAKLRAGIDKWPAWYADFCNFAEGFKLVRMGKGAEGFVLLDKYAASTNTAPEWAYAFKPVVAGWREQLAAWKKLGADVAPLFAAGKAGEARMKLETAYKLAPVFMRSMLDPDIQNAKRKEDEEKKGKAKDQELANFQKIQEELEKLGDAVTANMPLVARAKDFKKASAAISKLAGELATAEGKNAAAITQDAYDRMDALKEYMVSRFATQPFRSYDGTELGGPVIGASATGLRINVGAAGIITKPWDQVSTRTMVKMASYYAGSMDAGKAEMTLNLAVYCYYNGGFDTAATYLNQAVKLDAALQVKARKLLPDLGE